jgi:hypothetical protein
MVFNYARVAGSLRFCVSCLWTYSPLRWTDSLSSEVKVKKLVPLRFAKACRGVAV